MRLRAHHCLILALALVFSVVAFAQESPAKTRDTNEVATTVSGFRAAIDPATGRLRELTPAETAELSRALSALLKRPSDGLKMHTHDSGGVIVELDDSFMSVMMARVDEGGSVEHVCVDDAATALSFMTYGDRKNAAAAKPRLVRETE